MENIVVIEWRFRSLDVCLICTSEIEDEFHFLMSCPNYTELRTNMFAKISSVYNYFNYMEDIEKFDIFEFKLSI